MKILKSHKEILQAKKVYQESVRREQEESQIKK